MQCHSIIVLIVFSRILRICGLIRQFKPMTAYCVAAVQPAYLRRKYQIMKRALGVLLALLLVVSIAACSREEENTLPPVASGSAVVVTPEAQIPTNVEPSIKGYITRINYSVESTEILVEYYYDADTEPKYSYDKALVKVDSNTAIATDKGDSVPISSLTVGTVVEA